MEALYVLLEDTQFTGFDLYAYESGKWHNITSFREAGYYCWKKISLAGVTTKHLKMVFHGPSGKIDELFLTDDEEQIIGLDAIWSSGDGEDDVTNLTDEREYVEYPLTYRSQTYFDEIYYVRAAENYLNAEEPTERTHPPLGKLLIASSILAFGFNPLSWRLMGVLFATLMIPVIYVMGKIMFGTRIAAFVSSFLLTFDFLHFTMGRIATVDTFAVFFTTLGDLFFFLNYRNISRDGGRMNSLMVLSGTVSFALAFSIKWYTIYGLFGNIFLIAYFSLRNMKLSRESWRLRWEKHVFKPLLALLGSFAVGSMIYIATYIPYLTLGHDLRDLYSRQWSMYNFHAYLEATHPFSSDWWSWPLIIRPLWLFVSYIDGFVSTIVAMGNPLIWWFGIAFIPFLAWRALKTRDRLSIFLLSLLLFQWFPYAFIKRPLFIYHFYINVPIMILIMAYFLGEHFKDKKGRICVLAYLISVATLFFLFYPVISGYPVPYQYKEILRWFRSWIF